MTVLKNPQLDYPILHIAGTKGKGSVAAFCASVLQQAGYRVGLYTSPHLEEYRERFQVNRKPISQLSFIECVRQIKLHADLIPNLTTFELETAVAFLHFSQSQVDIAVVEVGLGGRLDATNVVLPLVSVITSISHDHTPILGNTLVKIATEKAGIIKPNVPVVFAPQHPEVTQCLERIAAEKQAPYLQIGQDISFTPIAHTYQSQNFQLQFEPAVVQRFPNLALPHSTPTTLEISLLGEHQIENAVTAYATLQIVHARGILIPPTAFEKGFAKTTWAGRFEILQTNPWVVMDSAHNPDSARRLRQTMDAYFPDLPVWLVLGILADKNAQGILENLCSLATQLLITQPPHPRALAADVLAKKAVHLHSNSLLIPSLEEAFNQALENAPPNGLVLVTGSLSMVGFAREYWKVKSKTD